MVARVEPLEAELVIVLQNSYGYEEMLTFIRIPFNILIK